MASGGRKTREERKQDRRDAIKQAAIQIISEKGYHAAKVSQIVDRVGIAQGTFYLYYEGKQQIFGELLSDFLTLVVTTSANWDPGNLESIDVLEDELRRVGLLLTEAVLENEDLAAIFFRESLAVAPEFDAMILEFYDTLGAMLTDVNRVLCERGIIAEMNFQLLAFETIGMVERVIREYVVTDTLRHIPPAEIVDHLIAHFISGTRVPVATAQQPPAVVPTIEGEQAQKATPKAVAFIPTKASSSEGEQAQKQAEQAQPAVAFIPTKASSSEGEQAQPAVAEQAQPAVAEQAQKQDDP